MIDRDLLNAYVDGEVTSAERATVDALLKNDPQASTELANIRQSKAFLANHCRPVESDEAWRTCVGRLSELDKTKRIEGFVGRYAWALCCVFFLVIVAGGVLRHLNPNSVRAGQVASYVSGLGGSWATAPSAGSQHEWQQEQFQPIQGMVHTNVLNVIGTKRGFVDGHQVLCYRLADSLGMMDLLVVSNADAIDGGQQLGHFLADNVNNANFVGWQQGDYVMFLLADATQRSPQDLAAIAQAIRLR